MMGNDFTHSLLYLMKLGSKSMLTMINIETKIVTNFITQFIWMKKLCFSIWGTKLISFTWPCWLKFMIKRKKKKKIQFSLSEKSWQSFCCQVEGPFSQWNWCSKCHSQVTQVTQWWAFHGQHFSIQFNMKCCFNVALEFTDYLSIWVTLTFVTVQLRVNVSTIFGQNWKSRKKQQQKQDLQESTKERKARKWTWICWTWNNVKNEFYPARSKACRKRSRNELMKKVGKKFENHEKTKNTIGIIFLQKKPNLATFSFYKQLYFKLKSWLCP